MRHDLGREHVFFLHVSLVPYLAPSGELKTKPTQHSVAALRNIGIQPDALICRSDRDIPENLKRKISLMCDVDAEAVISTPDAPSIYDIPRVLHREGLDAYVVRRLNLSFHDVDWTTWGGLLERVHHPAETVRIAVVGKYIDLPDAYLSVTEALRAGGFGNNARAEIVWVASDDCITPAGAAAALADVQGVLIPGGFGVRGIEGKIGAITYARVNRIPILGLCLGLQCMVIEVARSLAGLGGANSAEFDANAADPVIATMADQHDVVAGAKDMGGTMRLGAYPARLAPGSLVAEIYGSTSVSERHRHRYEVNNAYRDKLEAAGPAAVRHVPRLVAGRVRRAGPRAAPVHGGHPGPPGVQVPADPAAPAVRGVRPSRPGLPGVRAAAAPGRRTDPRTGGPVRGAEEPAELVAG